MDGNILGMLELLLVFGGLIAFALWELYSLRKYKKRESRQNPSDKPPE